MWPASFVRIACHLKALGCTSVTTERNAIVAVRAAPFADKHKLWVGFDNQTNNLPEMDKHDAILVSAHTKASSLPSATTSPARRASRRSPCWNTFEAAVVASR